MCRHFVSARRSNCRLPQIELSPNYPTDRFGAARHEACDPITSDLQVTVISWRSRRDVVKHTTIKVKPPISLIRAGGDAKRKEKKASEHIFECGLMHAYALVARGLSRTRVRVTTLHTRYKSCFFVSMSKKKKKNVFPTCENAQKLQFCESHLHNKNNKKCEPRRPSTISCFNQPEPPPATPFISWLTRNIYI